MPPPRTKLGIPRASSIATIVAISESDSGDSSLMSAKLLSAGVRRISVS
jgi:hypothetical protein